MEHSNSGKIPNAKTAAGHSLPAKPGRRSYIFIALAGRPKRNDAILANPGLAPATSLVSPPSGAIRMVQDSPSKRFMIIINLRPSLNV